MLWKVSRLLPSADPQVIKRHEISMSSRSGTNTIASYVLHEASYLKNYSTIKCTYIQTYMYVYPLNRQSLCDDKESGEEGEEESSEDEEPTSVLSEYEIRREKRIAENKKKFEEHFAAITYTSRSAGTKTSKKVKVISVTYDIYILYLKCKTCIVCVNVST